MTPRMTPRLDGLSKVDAEIQADVESAAPGVRGVVGLLEEAVDRLRDQVDQLGEQIGDILATDVAEQDAPGPGPAGMCALADRLYSTLQKVRRTQAALAALNRGVDL